MDIRHDPEHGRFIADLEGEDAVLDYERAGEKVLDYRHTFVPPEHRGQGIATRLVKFALDYARESGHRIIPTCPFVSRTIDDNPEYQELVAED